MTITIGTIYFIVILAAIVIFSGVTWKGIEKFIRYIKDKLAPFTSDDAKKRISKEIEKSILEIKKHKKGATIIIDIINDTSPFIVDSVKIDANISSDLISSLYISQTPLHDGAIVIRGERIVHASAYITSLSDNKSIPKSFGTRHRSALGISEQTHSLSIVLSEETKKISVFKKGRYTLVPQKDLFKTILNNWTN